MKFMGRPCPTITIVTEAGPVNINKADYDLDPSKYDLWEDDAPKAKKAEPKATEPEEKESGLKRRVKKRIKPDNN